MKVVPVRTGSFHDKDGTKLVLGKEKCDDDLPQDVQ